MLQRRTCRGALILEKLHVPPLFLLLQLTDPAMTEMDEVLKFLLIQRSQLFLMKRNFYQNFLLPRIRHGYVRTKMLKSMLGICFEKWKTVGNGTDHPA